MTSERIDQLAFPAEVFYRRLMSVVDDFGRYYAKHELLLAGLYPLRVTKVRLADIATWLGEVQAAGLVRTYQVDGKEYLELADFRQQARAKSSKYPQPPPRADQVHSACAADAMQPIGTGTASAPVVVFGDGGDSARTRAKRPKTPIPIDFGLSERVIEWAAAHGFGHLQEHLDSFRLKAVAHDYRYSDWDAALMNAIKADWAKVNSRPKPGELKAAV